MKNKTPIEFKRAAALSPDQIVLRAQIKKLNDALDVLIANSEEQASVISMLMEQLAEMSLRTRYIMYTFKYNVAPKSAILQPGITQPVDERTLFEIYSKLGGRERFLDKLQQEIEDARQTDDSDAGAARGGTTDDGTAGAPEPGASGDDDGDADAGHTDADHFIGTSSTRRRTH